MKSPLKFAAGAGAAALLTASFGHASDSNGTVSVNVGQGQYSVNLPNEEVPSIALSIYGGSNRYTERTPENAVPHSIRVGQGSQVTYFAP